MRGLRRGICPSLARPMLTGDGWLARLTPSAPIAIGTFIELCAAAQRHGNGIIEITQRGNLQVRGLSESSSSDFSRVAASLQSAVPSLLASPLLGLDAQEPLDLRDLVSELRSQLSARACLASLGPKVSVLIDSCGTMPMDRVTADIRVQATSNQSFHLALGGDAAQALHLGSVELRDVITTLDIALTWLASHGTSARMRDARCLLHVDTLRTLLATRLTPSPAPSTRAPLESIGNHPLNDGTIARGFGLAFGYATAAALEQFARVAIDCNVTTVAPAWERVLLMIGMTPSAADRLDAAAIEAGLLTEPHDARRYVVACAGAPACSSAAWSTRELAPAVAAAAAPMLDGSITIHLSGCSKGCAHPRPAAITLVGPDGLLVGGSAGDTAHARFSPEQLLDSIRHTSLAQLRERQLNETSSDVLARLGTAHVIEWLAPEDSQ